LNVLPRAIADRLKHEGGVIADSFPEATVLFADIKQFTPISARLSPEEVLTWLSGVFTSLDRLTEAHGLEKIKTVGDAYMAASGVPTPRPDHVEAAADLALAIRDEVRKCFTPDGEPLMLRIGMHTGPVVAGVLGTSKFAYDLWGDTVNLASRMESHGLEGCIQVSEEVYLRLRHRNLFEERGPVEIRGKGVLNTYFLTGKRALPADL
jgi:adenylate cyclase